jgi:biopolymer transport protein ExbB
LGNANSFAKKEIKPGVLMLTQMLLKVAFVGSEWILWVLMLLSFLNVGVIVDRLLYFRSHNVDGDLLAAQIAECLRVGDLKQAYALVQESDSIEHVVIAAGLQAFHRGAAACEGAMLAARARVKHELDCRLPIIASIGSNAPFIGLLGTVLGIIKAAHDLTGGGASGDHDANAVMAGVFEALIATAFGLCVAIPAVLSFNYFSRRVKSTLEQVDGLVQEVLAHQPAGDRPASTRSTQQAAAARAGHAAAGAAAVKQST